MPDSSQAHDPACSPWLAPTLLYLGASLAILCAFDELALRSRAPRQRAPEDMQAILSALHAYAREHDGRHPAHLSKLLGPRTGAPQSPGASPPHAPDADER